uniref:Uncharacterized protein n=1 Tax=Rhizophora mucronata TaxID=61149 RepID=A0A2P2IRZ0_RHIMU
MLMSPNNDYPEMIPVPSGNVQINAFDCVPSDQRQENLNAGQTNTIGLEVSGLKLAKLPTRPRLSHVKDLARSLDDPVENGNSHKIAADLIMRGYAIFCCMFKCLDVND